MIFIGTWIRGGTQDRAEKHGLFRASSRAISLSQGQGFRSVTITPLVKRCMEHRDGQNVYLMMNVTNGGCYF
jgi:hypothetical protein